MKTRLTKKYYLIGDDKKGYSVVGKNDNVPADACFNQKIGHNLSTKAHAISEFVSMIDMREEVLEVNCIMAGLESNSYDGTEKKEMEKCMNFLNKNIHRRICKLCDKVGEPHPILI